MRVGFHNIRKVLDDAMPLLILIAIATSLFLLVLMMAALGATEGGALRGVARIVDVFYVGNRQYVSIGIVLANNIGRPINVTGVNVVMLYESPSLLTVISVPGTVGVNVAPALPATLPPGAKLEMRITVPAHNAPISSVDITATVEDDSGNKMTVRVPVQGERQTEVVPIFFIIIRD